MIRLELWNGAAGARETSALRDFERILSELPTDDEVWSQAVDLARRARAAGVTVPATDLLIAACARRHGAGLEASDRHFLEIAALAQP